jgi:regulator of PEP synthase PpsR (kinase-PPPase family)
MIAFSLNREILSAVYRWWCFIIVCQLIGQRIYYFPGFFNLYSVVCLPAAHLLLIFFSAASHGSVIVDESRFAKRPQRANTPVRHGARRFSRRRFSDASLVTRQKEDLRGGFVLTGSLVVQHLLCSGGSMEHSHDLWIFVLSDGSGQTGKRVLEAALLQFDRIAMVVRIPYVATLAEVREVVAEAVRRGGMIVYTLVAVDLRQALHMAATEHGVITVDLLGGLLSKLQDFFQRTPWGRPGLLQQSDAGYVGRVEAMEFTVQHDDGQVVEDLPNADVVLVGASRTSKTPVSFYLAYRGWKVANVPLRLGVEPPEALRRRDPRAVVGLTIDRERLAVIRRAHLRHLQAGEEAAYADPTHIREELQYCLDLCRSCRWPVIDVTGKAVEETANEVINLVMPHCSGAEAQL